MDYTDICHVRERILRPLAQLLWPLRTLTHLQCLNEIGTMKLLLL